MPIRRNKTFILILIVASFPHTMMNAGTLHFPRANIFCLNVVYTYFGFIWQYLIGIEHGYFDKFLLSSCPMAFRECSLMGIEVYC